MSISVCVYVCVCERKREREREKEREKQNEYNIKPSAKACIPISVTCEFRPGGLIDWLVGWLVDWSGGLIKRKN